MTALDYAFAKRHGLVLLSLDEHATIGLREGFDPLALIEARRALGAPLKLQMLATAAFDRKFSEVYAGAGLASASGDDFDGALGHLLDDMPTAADLLDPQDDAPVIRLINGLIAEAVRSGASDIHIEPYEQALVVRLRVDGVLREILSLSPRIAAMLVSRVKVMAKLDIAEKRIPQDGRISLALGGKSLDVRVSTLPARMGERVVMRILDKEQAGLGLADLGMSPRMLAALEAALREPNGIVLVTGPTGSGKTTTLYAGLGLLNDKSRNILTIEDPVEYAVHGVGQTQVNTKVGMTFAAGLRAILRQDPDVVMVGEIRDAETAQIAVQASLTGHLVLSTVHTNDAAGAVVRLRDMGVEPFLLASTMRLIIAQRLVRRLCRSCAVDEPADAAAAALVEVPLGTPLRRPVGCAECGHTGFQGRIGVYEALRVDDAVRRLIGQNAAEDEIAAAGVEVALKDEARRYVLEGLTTVEEALRITGAGARDGEL
ncbi:type II secretion system protein GspE [Caulobacter flavus]|uniref:Type II secretion system protein E n=1 Tax=Caulobacter flavus TaxID=1679497 RepID=A0A2N5CNW7_9CAUL|nr:type II secretion system ATPase GspE [Caulobacter flavus]AYV48643.1 type II secretion system protein GspE [Caulobacter flavus]PLR08641.1 type II secretion system protein GspE [Caulobacter flavus]